MKYENRFLLGDLTELLKDNERVAKIGSYECKSRCEISYGKFDVIGIEGTAHCCTNNGSFRVNMRKACMAVFVDTLAMSRRAGVPVQELKIDNNMMNVCEKYGLLKKDYNELIEFKKSYLIGNGGK